MDNTGQRIKHVDITHFHLCCGIGAGAKGFNRGRAQVGNVRARFRCIGGVDNNPAAIRDFTRLTGTKGTCLDLFDRQQYRDFHGHEPPAGWTEAGTDDIRNAAGGERPNIIFTSMPCKGFSGLLSETKSLGVKYQALNRLTLRGMWLALEAWADDPPQLFIFENVPRIATRGRALLDQITELLRHYGYAVAETFHDCGELGGLAQSRKRFLLVARHQQKVPCFLYEPPKRPLRAVGEVLGKMPLPGNPAGGPMHSLPNLQWKTWVRLAFVEAGSDWRSLNKLNVVDGKLADYLIVPDRFRTSLGVSEWEAPAGTVTGNAKANNGSFSVADPRFDGSDYHTYGVRPWSEPAETVTGKAAAGAGSFSIADPRMHMTDNAHTNIFAIAGWSGPARTVTGANHVTGGAASVADPRLGDGPCGPHFNNVYRIVRWDQFSPTINGGNGPSAGGLGVADPRPPVGREPFGKYAVTKWDERAGTVISGDDSGAYAVADPRAPSHVHGKGKYKVTPFDAPAGTVIGESGTGNGGFAVADPRILNRKKGDHYLTGGQYGVIPWDSPSGAISAAAQHDSGRFNVADPRLDQLPTMCPMCCAGPIAAGLGRPGPICEGCAFNSHTRIELPKPDQKLVSIIRALDGTWHRPFTTLELAALQSLVDPDVLFDLEGTSDSAKRERIGNAVPPAAAQAIADLMGETLLLAWSGESFMLSALPVWVQPVAVALSVRVP